MKRELRSAGKFDRKLATLFEALEGREKELQSRLDALVRGLLDGGISTATVHHPTDDTCCLPLIDHYVVVFRTDQATAAGEDKFGKALVDFSNARMFDLLNIEQEDE